jgi:hypothetical protein
MGGKWILALPASFMHFGLGQTFFDKNQLDLRYSSPQASRVFFRDVLAIAVGGFPHLAFAGVEVAQPPFEIGSLFMQIVDESLAPRHFALHAI